MLHRAPPMVEARQSACPPISRTSRAARCSPPVVKDEHRRNSVRNRGATVVYKTKTAAPTSLLKMGKCRANIGDMGHPAGGAMLTGFPDGRATGRCTAG